MTTRIWIVAVYRTVASLFPRGSRLASLLRRDKVLRLLVGIRTRILRHPRDKVARFFRRHSVLLHAVYDATCDKRFSNYPIRVLLEGSRQVSAAAMGYRLQSDSIGYLRHGSYRHIRRSRGRPRLDAQLGAQQDRLVFHPRGCRNCTH